MMDLVTKPLELPSGNGKTISNDENKKMFNDSDLEVLIKKPIPVVKGKEHFITIKPSDLEIAQENSWNNPHRSDHSDDENICSKSIEAKSCGKSNDPQKCPHCNYVPSKTYFKQHILTHISNEDALKLRCFKCTYRTKNRGSLKKHELQHKTPDEITCPKSKYSSDLKAHMKIHKNASELHMFRCSTCSYESISKANLRRHMLVHQDDPNPSGTIVLIANTNQKPKRLWQSTSCSIKILIVLSLVPIVVIKPYIRQIYRSICAFIKKSEKGGYYNANYVPLKLAIKFH